jgi:anti-sigma factor RsiW
MHRRVRDDIESFLAEAPAVDGFRSDGSRNPKVESSLRHVEECPECGAEIAAMREQAALFRALRAPGDVEPRGGFYARVRERIEAQNPVSIWNLFFDSAFARRVAMGSAALALLIGIYLFSADRLADRTIVVTGQPDWVLTGGMPDPAESPDRDAVLVNLVTYREQ